MPAETPTLHRQDEADRRSEIAGRKNVPGNLRWLLALLIPLTLVRLFMAGQMELSPDEAYYTLWSERLDWAYYSKGPGVALAIRLGTALLGHTELGVRLLSPFLALGTTLLAWHWVRRYYSEPAALLTVAALSCAPIFNVGAIVLTIDPLSIFFWVAALVTFSRAIRLDPAQDSGTWPWWVATGLLTSLGFLCKYTNAFGLLGFVLALALLPEGRKAARTVKPWALLAGFAALAWPPLAWNARHGWVTATHLGERGIDNDVGFGIRPLELLEYLAMHAGVYSPFVFILLMVAMVVSVKQHRQPTARFLACFSVPIVLLYFTLSLGTAGEPNWTALAMVSLALFAGPLLLSWLERGSAASRWITGFGLGLGLLMSVLVTNLDLLRMAGVPLPYALDPGTRLRGWRSSAAEIARLRNQVERETGQPVFLICANYQVAAALSFYLDEPHAVPPLELPRDARTGFAHPPLYMIHSPGVQNQFSFWPSYLEPGSPWLGGSALFISDKDRESPPEKLAATFDTTETLSIFEITRRDGTLRRFTVFTCRGLKAPTAPETQN